SFETTIQAFIHPAVGTPWNDRYAPSHYAGNAWVFTPNDGMKIKDIVDGPRNTMLIGEAPAEFKPWGSPVGVRDPALGIARFVEGFGSPMGSSGGQFLFGDGSAKFLRSEIDPKVFRALCTPAGRETINEDDL